MPTFRFPADRHGRPEVTDRQGVAAPPGGIAGFFRELWPPSFGEPDGGVRDFVSSVRYEDAREITDYLLAGHVLFSAMGSSEDVLGTGRTILGGDSVFSDGAWIWRGDLRFYVWTHRVRLPDDFLARARSHHYAMPPENEPELARLSTYVQENIQQNAPRADDHPEA